MIYEINNDMDMNTNNDTDINNDNFIENDDAMATSPVYPGTSLKLGSSGSHVSIMQSYMNAIRTGMFPSMTRLTVDGIFGQRTRNAVIQYQGLSGLAQDGIIGRNTWEAIVSDYENLPTTPSDTYPGYVLRPGSSGASVRNMQTKLNRISPTYSGINTQTVDGQYGTNMTNAVRRFQIQFGLTADGLIGPLTWNKINSVHTGVQNNNNVSVTTAYPGYVLTTGSQGDHVRFVQSYLNAISADNNYGWQQLAVDGVFGQMTRRVTIAFQQRHNLTADGIVGRNTWAALIRHFNMTL